ncbi:hypothetical protein CcaverHIS002_0307330 [Cutaneotrichosporon cavernicola]|uniref:Amino acid transporter n=1 Tax=Cutaneotrichosporon cavernicola TaxID=279322 RepID=A0AA48I3N9_9TREE|nr:uncharacterized protein CcaverHIS019_0307240 [Cutaneotrichosporon cavernicola]BEI82865.1 hypothetical protein CcaverHIS002_0307330 [Cutaneotrichosporon cavernicola]BEI90654.1 hypothetical protein CcaverHIS019_0307240 [Cutaneotrichosporon cavernicola]
MSEDKESTIRVGRAPERSFSLLSCLGLAFTTLNSWCAVAASFPLVLPSGGSVSMVWGLVVSTIGTMAMAISLAEICHAFPTSGGQYDWAYMLAPPALSRPLSFLTAWNVTAGWVALGATAATVGARFILGIVALWNGSAPRAWQVFLITLAFVLHAAVLNIFGARLLPLINRVSGVWSILGIMVIVVTVLACSSGEYQPADEVFARWTNETGWPDGMAFILGLLQSTFGLTAFDSVAFMVDHMPRPAINAPKTMVIAVLLGAVTSWVYLIALLFCIKDLRAVMSSPTGPLLQMYFQATGSKAGSTILMIFNLGAMLFASQGLITVSSRLVLRFARDRGLGALSSPLSTIHPALNVPLFAILAVTTAVLAIAAINLGSSIALNAVLSATVVLLQVSYTVPIALLFMRGGSVLGDTERRWALGRWRRIVNGGALVFLLVTTVTFLFPPKVPVRGGDSMNWVVVVAGVVWLACGITWAVDGRRRFHGPSELADRLAAAKAA